MFECSMIEELVGCLELLAAVFALVVANFSAVCAPAHFVDIGLGNLVGFT